MNTTFLYPGQGAQDVGMGKDLCEKYPAARAMFEQAEKISGLPLMKLCFEGPKEELSRTDVAQPAIFTMSAAVAAAAGGKLASPAFAAGLSLGEYTALYAAGAMDFATGVKLVTQRGRLMQQAATAVPSGMVSVIGMDEAQAQALCLQAAQGEVLVCANFNCPGQIVLSGQKDACRRAAEMAPAAGAKMAVPLDVAGAFHSALMAPAAEKFAAVLAGVAFKNPSCVVLSNVDAQPYASAGDIAAKLLAQLVQPVRWQQCMEYLIAQGGGPFYEIGPGRVLAGLAKRIDRKLPITCVNAADAVEQLTANA
ncbi:MAG: ACP S-malonyltransferase [Planctomycetaceae bacterium]|nr:ACP S-malonyltransferase [Planctomycetaceae bacterium]